MGQQLLANGAFQVNQLSAGLAFQMEMVTAISPSHVLIHVGGLGITAVFSYRSLGAKLGEMAIQGAFAVSEASRCRGCIQRIRQLLCRELAVGIILKKREKSLSSRRFVGTCHGRSPFGLMVIRKTHNTPFYFSITVYHKIRPLSINLRMILKFITSVFKKRSAPQKGTPKAVSFEFIPEAWSPARHS